MRQNHYIGYILICGPNFTDKLMTANEENKFISIPLHFRDTEFPTYSISFTSDNGEKKIIIRDKSKLRHERETLFVRVDMYKHSTYEEAKFQAIRLPVLQTLYK